MDEASIRKYMAQAFPDVEVTEASSGTFYFTDPAKMFPFATLVTNDENDVDSDLNRSGVYRLNVGVCKETFRGLFGTDTPADGYDFTTLDVIMPHPVYGKMYWVCVLNPSTERFETVRELLAEAYKAGMRKRGENL